MAFRYELKLADSDDAGTFETAVPNWQVGDEFIASGNRHFRIRAIVPVERIGEFIDKPTYGLWEVEPL